MKVVINRDNFCAVASVVTQAIQGRVVVPIWECLYLQIRAEKCYIFGRGMEFQIKGFCKVDADEDHDICVPGKLFYDTVRLMSDEEVIFKTNDKFKTTVTVKGGKQKYNVTGFNPEDYEVMTLDKRTAKVMKMQSTAFLKAVAAVSGIVNGNDLRASLSGVAIRNGQKRVEVIGFRGSSYMGRLEIDSEEDFGSIIMTKTVATVLSQLKPDPEITIGTDGNKIAMSMSGFSLTGVLIAHEIPKIDQFWDGQKDKGYITVDRGAFTAAMKRLKLYAFRAKDKNLGAEHIVRMKVEGSLMSITAESVGKINDGFEEVDIDNQNLNDMEIGVNPVYMLDIISKMESDIIKISMTNEKSGIFLYEYGVDVEPIQNWLLMPYYIPEK